MNMKKQKHNVNYVCCLNHITLHPTLHILQKWHTWTESSPKMYFDQTQAMSAVQNQELDLSDNL